MFLLESKIFLWIKPKKKKNTFFAESLDQCRRLEVCEKARNVFCDEPVRLSDHKVSQHKVLKQQQQEQQELSFWDQGWLQVDAVQFCRHKMQGDNQAQQGTAKDSYSWLSQSNL